MKIITMQQAQQLLEQAEKLSHEERMELQNERLHELVDTVRKSSPYFQKLYVDLPENYTLEDLPYTEKSSLMEIYEDWVTDREITKESVLQYIDRDINDTSLYLGKYSALTTSGTTGSPMPMIRDFYHNTLHTVMMGRRLLGNVTENYSDLSKYKVAAIIFTDPHVSSYGSFLRLQNSQKEYAQNAIALSPLEGTDTIIKKLNEFQPDMLTCYPSALCAMAIEQKKGVLNISPKLIACSAEVLSEDMYELFTEAFHCPVINNYCSTEAGEAAMASNCPHLHINEDWVIIEPVDANRNVITNSEEWSDGIFITDLTNYAQPIIRYYMNDRVRIHKNCNCNNPFPYMEIMGRTGGVTTICEKTIIIANFYSVMEYIDHTYALQLVQTAGDTIEIRAIFTPEADQDAIFAVLEQRLKNLLDKEGCKNYTILRSEKEPERNKCGGKLPYFINKCN